MALTATREYEPLLPDALSSEARVKTSRHVLNRYILAAGVYQGALYLTNPSRPALILAATSSDSAAAALFTGVVDSFQAVFGVFAAPVLGSFADTLGRVPVLLFCTFVQCITFILVVLFRSSLSGMFVAFLLTAISDSALVTILSAIADLSPDQRTGTRAFAGFGASKGAALVLAPALGGLIVSAWFMAGPFLVGALIFAIALPFFSLLPDTRVSDTRMDSARDALRAIRWESPIPKVRCSLSETRALSLLVLATVVLSLAENGLDAILFIYFNEVVRWESKEFGVFSSAVGVVMMVSQLLLASRVEQAFGQRALIVSGFLFNGVHFIIYALARHQWVVWCGLLLSVPYFASLPALKAVVARQVPTERQGELQGSLAAVNSLVRPVSSLGVCGVFALCSSYGYSGVAFLLIALFSWGAGFIVNIALTRPELK